ncbi:hypothetical protein EGW08_009918 [Elysia chlorotica]|uniref:Uncharacterized protein n=1 Tax=Elysia chlorotica TaxID=188477 RepID=A0A433TL99_ELYCH|nr:hypothetical protein EGW08_009918 [Elysia chlorotica]
MARASSLLWSAVVVGLVCVQLVAGMDLESICERRCLYGRGGPLCGCNAVHFAGKRSLYRGDHVLQDLVNPGGVKVEEINYLSHGSPGSPGSSPGKIGGPQTSNRKITALATQLLDSWDSDMVGQLLSSLKRLKHGKGNFQNFLDKQPGNFNSKGTFSSRNPSAGHTQHPVITWAKFLESQGEEPILRQRLKLKQNFPMRSFRYPDASRVSEDLTNGNPQSEADPGDADSVGQALANDPDGPTGRGEQVVSLQDALRRAMGDDR